MLVLSIILAGPFQPLSYLVNDALWDLQAHQFLCNHDFDQMVWFCVPSARFTRARAVHSTIA